MRIKECFGIRQFTFSFRNRLMLQVFLALGILLAAPLVRGSGDSQLLSVKKLPPLHGMEHAQMAVKWSGELPVVLQVGVSSSEDGFVPIGASQKLTKTMTLLPDPTTDGSVALTWQVLDAQSQVLAQTRGTTSSSGWQPEFIGPGLDYHVHAAAVFNGDLVVAGRFATAGGSIVSRIARWNGSNWSELGGPSGVGVNGRVRALTVYGTELIATGGFTQAGGVLASGVARWDGTEWSALEGASGEGLDVFSGFALTVFEGELIVGGNFRGVGGGVDADYIARWNGQEWFPLTGSSGDGVNDDVSALAVYDGELIVGGSFSNAGGAFVDNIARWDGNEWSALSGPFATGMDRPVSALAVFNDDLIAGGNFTTAGGVDVDRIARWNGNAWSALAGSLGTGVNCCNVRALTVLNGSLIVGGGFSEAGGVTVNGVARWNGSSWAALNGPSGTGVARTAVGGNSSDVLALTVYSGDLIVGGLFNEAGGLVVNHIARWSGTDWSTLTGSAGQGVDARVYAMTLYDGDLIVAGNFYAAGGAKVNGIARWDGQTWSILGGPTSVGIGPFLGRVEALTVYQGDLIAGGLFDEAGGITVNNIARWDGNNWSALSGLSGTGVVGGFGSPVVHSLAVFNEELIVGGSFLNAGGVRANNIARWNGQEWFSLEGPLEIGVTGSVFALTVYDEALIAGGTFDEAGGVVVNHIASWDGNVWSGLAGPNSVGTSGPGSQDVVYALSIFEGDLIAGGSFSGAGGVAVGQIGRWNGFEWATLSGLPDTGIYLSGLVLALNTFEAELIVGGDFGGVELNGNNLSADGLARWNGEEWIAPPPGGISGNQISNKRVRALAEYGGDLIAGGLFFPPDGDPNFLGWLGRYVVPRPEIALSVGELEFYNLEPGQTSEPLALVITNVGISNLDIAGVSLDAVTDEIRVSGGSVFAFGTDSCTGASLSIGESCTIEVVFTPLDLGLQQALLRIDSDVPDSPTFVPLTGDPDVIFLDRFQ